MKKEFIMPSLEMKKFSKVLVMDASAPEVVDPVPSNIDEAERKLTEIQGIVSVARLTL